ncbi:hypothetical protein ACRAWF_22825 [Streptomyces sp. L7]
MSRLAEALRAEALDAALTDDGQIVVNLPSSRDQLILGPSRGGSEPRLFWQRRTFLGTRTNECGYLEWTATPEPVVAAILGYTRTSGPSGPQYGPVLDALRGNGLDAGIVTTGGGCHLICVYLADGTRLVIGAPRAPAPAEPGHRLAGPAQGPRRQVRGRLPIGSAGAGARSGGRRDAERWGRRQPDGEARRPLRHRGGPAPRRPPPAARTGTRAGGHREVPGPAGRGTGPTPCHQEALDNPGGALITITGAGRLQHQDGGGPRRTREPYPLGPAEHARRHAAVRRGVAAEHPAPTGPRVSPVGAGRDHGKDDHYTRTVRAAARRTARSLDHAQAGG